MPVKTRRATVSPEYQLLSVNDMTGGVDLRRTPTQLGETRARTIVNFRLSEPGALTVRPGYTQYTTASLGSGRIQGAHRVQLSSQTFTLAAHGGIVYQPESTGWGSAVYSTINSTAQVFFPHDRDIVAVMDGSANPIRKSTNGSSWTRMGIAPSTSASTLSSGGGGSLLHNNEYEVSYTYRNDSAVHDPVHESLGSTALSTITVSGDASGDTNSITIEVHGSTDPQVGLIRYYVRNKTAGETVRRFSTSSSNKTDGSTISVTITSSDWSAAAPEPTDRDVPPALWFAKPWKNRWWARHATIGNRLHFTQVFQPQSWPATFFLDIPFDRGDEIRAIETVGDTLIVFGDSGHYLIVGQTSLDFDVRPSLGALDGALGPRSVAVIESGVLHAGISGIYLFDGAQDRLMSFDIEPAWRDAMTMSALDDIVRTPMIYHERDKEVRVAVTRRYPSTQLGEWVLDLNRTRIDEVEAWAATDRDIGGYIHFDGAETDPADRGRLQSWNTTSGILNEESTGTTANSSNIKAQYEGPTFALGIHRGRIIDLRGEYEPHSGSYSVETEVDGLSQGVVTIPVGAAVATYS